MALSLFSIKEKGSDIMPFINSKVTVKGGGEKEEAIKQKLGQAISDWGWNGGNF